MSKPGRSLGGAEQHATACGAGSSPAARTKLHKRIRVLDRKIYQGYERLRYLNVMYAKGEYADISDRITRLDAERKEVRLKLKEHKKGGVE